MLGKYLSFCHSEDASSSQKCYLTVIEELCPQFSLADLRKSTNNFDENQVTRRSVFNTVYKGCLKHNGVTDYAVTLKRLKSKSDQWKFRKEIEFHCQLSHPNLDSLIGFCDHKEEKILVYEHMSNGSLYDCLCSKDFELLSWKKRLEICIGAARGLHYLHTGAKRSIFHCDIKPQNILLDSNMVPKLSHLGFSLQGPLLRSKAKPIKVDMMIGTPGFMAPEYVLTKTFTDKCDVYSFGIVLMVVLSTSHKQSFFEKMYMMADSDLFLEEPLSLMTPYVDIPSFLERISVGEIIDPVLLGKIAPECLGVFIDITKRCLSKDANERPDMGEVQVELEQALALQEDEDACPEP
ncbi:receptor-like protein kinase ANXUR2 [Arachis hypogaea]|nr:receptor-like protein kinase ANXUR2 isoform X2 [Arachis hypogaea]QHO10148.1 Receptor-like protein kinase [Arachis hypogaea]QHO10149.1 Receptor-like protein kinase [Arachis hypogaea]